MLLAGVLCSLAATPLGARDCVSVTALDPDGLPVSGARAVLGDAEATTGTDGRAELCDAAPGATLTVSADGFAAYESTPQPGSTSLEVRLEVAGRVETPVVVTGVIHPRKAAEVDRTVAVLSVQDPAAPAWSFADLLKQDSSLHLRERGPDGTQADLSIRGSSFDQVQVLINGVRVSDAQTGHHSLDLPLPYESVEQVEVLHGGGATLYGSDAIGGAVNFVTRQPETSELRLMAGGGEHGWHRQAATGAVRQGLWTQTFAFARDMSSGFAPGRDFRNTAFSTETFLDHSVGSTDILVAVNERPFGANGFYGPWDSFETTGTKMISATQTFGRDADKGVHRLNFAFRRHDDDFILCRSGCVFGGRQFAPSDNQNIHQLDTYQGNYSYQKRFNRQVQVSGGLQFLSEGIDSNVAGQRTRARGSAFGVLDLRPTDRWTVSVGLREEVWRKWSAQTSPTIATGYRLGAGFKIRGQVNRAFRIPTYTDLYHRDPGNVGNSALLPETAWNYEAGADWYSPFGTRISGTWFQRRETNTIDWVKDDGSSVFQARNFQEIDFNGFEVQVRQRFRGGHEAWFNYTGLEADRRLPVNAISRYVFNFPLNNMTLGYRGTLVERLHLKTQLGVYNRTWQSSRGLWDVSLSWQGRRISPFLQATNLSNTQHEAFRGLQQPGRWVRGGVRLTVF